MTAAERHKRWRAKGKQTKIEIFLASSGEPTVINLSNPATHELGDLAKALMMASVFHYMGQGLGGSGKAAKVAELLNETQRLNVAKSLIDTTMVVLNACQSGSTEIAEKVEALQATTDKLMER